MTNEQLKAAIAALHELVNGKEQSGFMAELPKRAGNKKVYVNAKNGGMWYKLQQNPANPQMPTPVVIQEKCVKGVLTKVELVKHKSVQWGDKWKFYFHLDSAVLVMGRETNTQKSLLAALVKVPPEDLKNGPIIYAPELGEQSATGSVVFSNLYSETGDKYLVDRYAGIPIDQMEQAAAAVVNAAGIPWEIREQEEYTTQDPTAPTMATPVAPTPQFQQPAPTAPSMVAPIAPTAPVPTAPVPTAPVAAQLNPALNAKKQEIMNYCAAMTQAHFGPEAPATDLRTEEAVLNHVNYITGQNYTEWAQIPLPQDYDLILSLIHERATANANLRSTMAAANPNPGTTPKGIPF